MKNKHLNVLHQLIDSVQTIKKNKNVTAEIIPFKKKINRGKQPKYTKKD